MAGMGLGWGIESGSKEQRKLQIERQHCAALAAVDWGPSLRT